MHSTLQRFEGAHTSNSAYLLTTQLRLLQGFILNKVGVAVNPLARRKRRAGSGGGVAGSGSGTGQGKPPAAGTGTCDDTDGLTGRGVPYHHYMSAQVGTAACRWFRTWKRGRQAGDGDGNVALSAGGSGGNAGREGGAGAGKDVGLAAWGWAVARCRLGFPGGGHNAPHT